MQRVERLGLGFGDGRDVLGARQAAVPGEGAAGVLDDQSLRRGIGGGLKVEEGAKGVWLCLGGKAG